MDKLYRVKPLEWIWRDGGYWIARTPVGHFIITALEDGSWVLDTKDVEQVYAYCDSAKKAAWGVFLSRLMPALEDVTLPEGGKP
jgi:DNA-directed RNA polymerase